MFHGKKYAIFLRGNLFFIILFLSYLEHVNSSLWNFGPPSISEEEMLKIFAVENYFYTLIERVRHTATQMQCEKYTNLIL